MEEINLRNIFREKGGEDLEYEFKDEGKISRAANGEIDREMVFGEKIFRQWVREKWGRLLGIQDAEKLSN